MRRFLAVAAGFIGAALLSLQALAQTNDEDALPPGEYHLKLLPFDQLSEKSVSRQGDAALNLKSVQWQHSESDHFIFHTETDVISDVNKIHRFGCTERMDSAASLIAALDSLKRKRVLP